MFFSSAVWVLTKPEICFRVCCPERGAQARGPPAGESPCSRMWSLQQSPSQTVAGDSRPHWSTLTPLLLTLSSSSQPRSRETTGNGHIGMSTYSVWKYLISRGGVKIEDRQVESGFLKWLGKSWQAAVNMLVAHFPHFSWCRISFYLCCHSNVGGLLTAQSRAVLISLTCCLKCTSNPLLK